MIVARDAGLPCVLVLCRGLWRCRRRTATALSIIASRAPTGALLRRAVRARVRARNLARSSSPAAIVSRSIMPAPRVEHQRLRRARTTRTPSGIYEGAGSVKWWGRDVVGDAGCPAGVAVGIRARDVAECVGWAGCGPRGARVRVSVPGYRVAGVGRFGCRGISSRWLVRMTRSRPRPGWAHSVQRPAGGVLPLVELAAWSCPNLWGAEI